MESWPSWKGSAPSRNSSISSWCLAYKIGLAATIAGLIVFVLGTSLTMLALSWQQEGQAWPHWMTSLSSMGWGAWHARNSGLGKLAELYYTCMLPLFPASIVATYAFSTYETDGALKAWITQHQTTNGIFARCISVVFFPLLGALFLKTFSGSDARLLQIAGEPSAMIFRGWIPFVALGAVTAVGPCALRILMAQRRK